MITSAKLFRNFFNDKEITSTRLSMFGDFVLAYLKANNIKGINDDLIALIEEALDSLHAELGDVNVALALQKGKTLTNDQVLTQFKTSMSEEEPFIARALGGAGTEAYLQFYPAGIRQYTQATKTHMPDLTYQVARAAEANSAALGATLTTLLVSFEEGWKQSRDTHLNTKVVLRDTRHTRTSARIAVEMAMLKTVHTIGYRYPGDVAKCSVYFDFNLLVTHTQHKHRTYSNALAVGETTLIINRSFTDTATIMLRNTDDNAAIAVWLAPTADGEAGPAAITLQASESKELKPSKLGNLANTFLLVKNLSEVNEAAYEVEIVG